MKEYLVKNNGVYTKTNLASSDCIEIPEGATMLLYCESNNGFYHFANDENKLMATYAMKNGNASWYGDADSYIKYGAEVVWRRELEVEMKEYLRKNINGEFELIKVPEQESKELHANSWLEVPDGAEFLTCLDTSEEKILIFWKEGHKKCLCCDEDWVSDQPPMSNYMDSYQANIVWRSEKTFEYLDPSDWSLKVVGENSPISGSWIKVPEGACFYHDFSDIGGGAFYKENYSEVYDCNRAFDGWLKCYSEEKYISKHSTLRWTRHTKPEALPFIDDEPKYKELDQLILENSENIEIPESWKENRNASDIADAALKHIRERAVNYDQADGERSAAKTAKAFNAITGKDITESEVWLMLQLLKDVRQWSRDEYHVDSAEDCIAYAALKAESLEKSNVSHNQSS